LRRLIAAAVLASLALAMWPRPADGRGLNGQDDFVEAVTVEGIREHQAAFQAIADANGGHRTAGTGGYDVSAQYVYDRARAAGYDVSVQEFVLAGTTDRTPPMLEQSSPAPRGFAPGVDFVIASYSGSGEVTAEVVAVKLIVPSPEPNTATSGCAAADFAGFPAGRIALVQRGTCTFRTKAEHALAAGALGVILFNEGNAHRSGLFSIDLGRPLFSLPVVGTTFAVGDELRNHVLDGPTGVVALLRTDAIAVDRPTHNVIAETREGDPTRVVVIGAHLDSVFEGPGINDNGSGSAVILEVAEVYAAQHRRPRNKLRFIWFGAEEPGLVGSTFYVDSLTQTERDHVLAMLNFDMVGSPNFVRFVYDGDNSAFPAGQDGVLAGPPGSGIIEQVFLDYFASRGLPTEPDPLTGLSDHEPFIAAGIPVGGLFTGADGVKTPEQAAVYGGTAGEPYDPCYHLACDTLDNVSLEALEQMAGAIAHAVLFFSETTRDVRER
jgi:Zn-dependent M28 family amino/carboxypeptidase